LKKFIKIFLVVWLIINLVYFAVYMAFVEFQWQFIYYYVWLIVFGFPLWLYRDKASVIIKSWKVNRHLKFFLLAYAMVLLEEIFAAFLNHMSEGFNIWIFFQRVGQFWFFNILAFTGLIFAVWFLYNRFEYSFAEMFCLAGLTGLYSERIIFYIPAELQVFVVFAPIMLFTYGLILSPALISIDIPHRRKLHFFLRLTLMLLAWYLFSQPPVFLLSILRSNYPFLFPPCQFIPCG
jgi:hypothetical protein